MEKRKVGCASAAMVETGVDVKWEELESLLGGKKFGPQPRVAHATERIFGPGNDASKLVVYRDNSAWCPYCERLWLLLEEKQLNYTVEKINMWCYGQKPEWYTRMVPSGLLPAVVLDGKLLTESLDIMLLLESKFSDKNPMLPRPGSPQWSSLDGLLQLERRLFGAWLSRLKGKSGAFDSTMDTVNAALNKFGGPYFLGPEFSLIDAVYAPFLERIAASMPYWPGLVVRGNDRWPAVNRWYDAMDSRPAYQAIKSDDFYIVHNLEPQIGACRSEPQGAAWRAHIDGTQGSWQLPLKPEVTAWGADDGTGDGGAREEAAQCFIKNHEAVVGFALRGVKDDDGTGRNAEAVDLGFRYVAKALLLGTDRVPLPATFPRKDAVAGAAQFLMNKVGVPRDLTYPAARQLRAHLLWLLQHCQGASR